MTSDQVPMIPKMRKLDIPKLIVTARHLSAKGKLAVFDNNLVYLDVDDAYIHQLFPLLKDKTLKKPDYFGIKSVGAHITVIYPEENKKIDNKDLAQTHSFLIKDSGAAEINQKIYYVLLVESPSLLQLRKKHNLPDLLYFKGYSIGFHITIGVKMRCDHDG